MKFVLTTLLLAASLVGCADPKKEAEKGNNKLAAAGSLISQGLKDQRAAKAEIRRLEDSKGNASNWTMEELSVVKNLLVSAREKYSSAQINIADALSIDSKNDNVKMSNRGQVEDLYNQLERAKQEITALLSRLEQSAARKSSGGRRESPNTGMRKAGYLDEA